MAKQEDEILGCDSTAKEGYYLVVLRAMAQHGLVWLDPNGVACNDMNLKSNVAWALSAKLPSRAAMKAIGESF